MRLARIWLESWATQCRAEHVWPAAIAKDSVVGGARRAFIMRLAESPVGRLARAPAFPRHGLQSAASRKPAVFLLESATLCLLERPRERDGRAASGGPSPAPGGSARVHAARTPLQRLHARDAAVRPRRLVAFSCRSVAIAKRAAKMRARHGCDRFAIVLLGKDNSRAGRAGRTSNALNAEG